MFKGSKVFKFNKFPFKIKYNNKVVYSVNSNYFFSRGKQEKNCWNNSLIKYTVNSSFLSINIPPKLDDFLRES